MSEISRSRDRVSNYDRYIRDYLIGQGSQAGSRSFGRRRSPPVSSSEHGVRSDFPWEPLARMVSRASSSVAKENGESPSVVAKENGESPSVVCASRRSKDRLRKFGWCYGTSAMAEVGLVYCKVP